MTRFLKATRLLATWLGFLLALPGLLLLMGASQINSMLLARELAATEHARDLEVL